MYRRVLPLPPLGVWMAGKEETRTDRGNFPTRPGRSHGAKARQAHPLSPCRRMFHKSVQRSQWELSRHEEISGRFFPTDFRDMCELRIADELPRTYFRAWRLEVPHAAMNFIERRMKSARVSDTLFAVPPKEMVAWVRCESGLKKYLGMRKSRSPGRPCSPGRCSSLVWRLSHWYGLALLPCSL